MSGVHIALAKAKKRVAELEKELSTLAEQTHIYMGVVGRLANDFPDVWDEVCE